jgi:DNA polymerase-4
MPPIRAQGLTLVGIALQNLERADRMQLTLPLDGEDASALDAALDAIRNRYGTTAVTRAVLLGRDPGIAMPLLPDSSDPADRETAILDSDAP